MVLSCNSSFSKGSFTQDLVAVINTFDDVQATTEVAASGRPSATETSATTASGAATTGNNGFVAAPDAENGSESPATDTPLEGATPVAADTQMTSPTGGAAPAAASPPASPPALVLPNPSPTARTTFAGAMIKAYEAGVNIFVPVFLPSGLELTNVRGWGPAQWDAQIERANPQDLAALTSLKANYDTVIQPLIDDVTGKVAANNEARKAHNDLLLNWGKTAGTSSSSGTNRTVADDDASGGTTTSSSSQEGRE